MGAEESFEVGEVENVGMSEDTLFMENFQTLILKSLISITITKFLKRLVSNCPLASFLCTVLLIITRGYFLKTI